ncbi:MAG: LamG domain-containing protein [archaeon]
MFHKKKLIALFLIILFGISIAYATPSFVYKRTITIDHTKVGTINNTDQNYFPVLVSLSDTTLKNINSGGHIQSTNGYDITFYSDINLNTQLAHEVESYDSNNGIFVAWVKIPKVSHTTDANFYIAYDANVITSMENKNAVWDDNGNNYFKGVWHLNETGSGVSGEYKDSTANSDNGTLTGNSVLKAAYNMTASANSYLYEDLNNVTDYNIVSGDTLEYDIYWTSAIDNIAVDFNTTTGGTLRASGAVDQNGLLANPTSDLSALALNKWYHRTISIPAGFVGKIINTYDIACENDTTSTKTAYLNNIIITNNATVNKKIYSSGDSFTHTTHTATNGTINSFANITNPTATIVVGKMTNALNSTGTRYANMTTTPSTAIDNWTLEAWLNPSTLPINGFAIYNGNDSGGYGFGIGAANNANMGSKLQGLYGVIAWIDSNYTFNSTNTWYDIAMVRSSGTVRFYVNGVQTTGTSTATPNTPTSHFTIGNQLDPTNTPYRFINGVIEEVRMSSTPRSADWIATNYNNQNSPGNFGAPSFYSIGSEALGPGYVLSCSFSGPDTNWQTCWPVFDANVKAQYQLNGENTLHTHDLRYYTQTQSDTNWKKYTLLNADINWIRLQNYPTACPNGKVISQLTDTNFNCITVGSSGTDTNWQISWSTFDANLKATYPVKTDINAWYDARYNPIGTSSIIKTTTANQSTSNSPTSMTELNISLAANKHYGFHCRLIASINATNRGIQLAMRTPTSPTYFSAKIIGWTSTSAITTTNVTASDSYQANTTSQGALNYEYEIMGSIDNLNSGTLAPMYQTSNSSATATINAGSWCLYTQGA